MKHNPYTFKAVLFLVMVTGTISAQDFSKSGTGAAQFLKIPVGAKAISMASTFTSIANDITALYWNPAGIAQIEKFSSGFSHSQWIAEINHDFLGVVLPIGSGSSVGINVIQLSSGDMESTTINQPNGTGTYFDATDMAISLSYGKYLIDQVSVGISGKYIRQRIWNTNASTFAIDLGIVLHTGYYGMNMGFSFKNFGSELKMSGSNLLRSIDQDPNSNANPNVEAELKTQPFSLPTSYRASMSMPILGTSAPIEMDNSSFTIAIDAVHLNDNPEHYSVGAEYGFLETFFVRGGYVFQTDEEGLSLGSGVKVNFGSSVITFDYAYASFGVFNAINVFTVDIRP